MSRIFLSSVIRFERNFDMHSLQKNQQLRLFCFAFSMSTNGCVVRGASARCNIATARVAHPVLVRLVLHRDPGGVVVAVKNAVLQNHVVGVRATPGNHPNKLKGRVQGNLEMQ